MDEDCSICREPIKDDKEILVCNHSFHIICIRTWLQLKGNCPICRRFINNISDEESDEDSDEESDEDSDEESDEDSDEESDEDSDEESDEDSDEDSDVHSN
jgi:hypothetical protein